MVHFPLLLACLPAYSRSADRCRHADRVRPPACRGCGAGRGEGFAAIVEKESLIGAEIGR